MFLTEDEGRAEGANEAKENITKKETNRPSHELRIPFEESPPSPERSWRHNHHAVDGNSLAANRDKLHECDGSRKRRRDDEPETLDDTSGLAVGAKWEWGTKLRKKCT